MMRSADDNDGDGDKHKARQRQRQQQLQKQQQLAKLKFRLLEAFSSEQRVEWKAATTTTTMTSSKMMISNEERITDDNSKYYYHSLERRQRSQTITAPRSSPRPSSGDCYDYNYNYVISLILSIVLILILMLDMTTSRASCNSLTLREDADDTHKVELGLGGGDAVREKGSANVTQQQGVVDNFSSNNNKAAQSSRKHIFKRTPVSETLIISNSNNETAATTSNGGNNSNSNSHPDYSMLASSVDFEDDSTSKRNLHTLLRAINDTRGMQNATRLCIYDLILLNDDNENRTSCSKNETNSSSSNSSNSTQILSNSDDGSSSSSGSTRTRTRPRNMRHRLIVYEDTILHKRAENASEQQIMSMSHEGESRSDPSVHWKILYNDTAILVVRSANKYYYWTWVQTIGSLVIFCMIVVGNSSILHRLKSTRRRRSNVNYFIVQLAIADLLVGVFSVTLDSLLRIQKAFVWGLFACRASKCISVLFIYSSTNLLVALSFDRWEAVVKPLAFTRNSSQRGYHLVMISWALAFLFSLPVVCFTKIKNIDGLPQCWIDLDNYGWRIYLIYLTSLLLILPTLIIAVCYTHIVYTIWSKGRLVSNRKENRKARRLNGGLSCELTTCVLGAGDESLVDFNSSTMRSQINQEAASLRGQLSNQQSKNNVGGHRNYGADNYGDDEILVRSGGGSGGVINSARKRAKCRMKEKVAKWRQRFKRSGGSLDLGQPAAAAAQTGSSSTSGDNSKQVPVSAVATFRQSTKTATGDAEGASSYSAVESTASNRAILKRENKNSSIAKLAASDEIEDNRGRGGRGANIEMVSVGQHRDSSSAAVLPESSGHRSRSRASPSPPLISSAPRPSSSSGDDDESAVISNSQSSACNSSPLIAPSPQLSISSTFVINVDDEDAQEERKLKRARLDTSPEQVAGRESPLANPLTLKRRLHSQEQQSETHLTSVATGEANQLEEDATTRRVNAPPTPLSLLLVTPSEVCQPSNADKASSQPAAESRGGASSSGSAASPIATAAAAAAAAGRARGRGALAAVKAQVRRTIRTRAASAITITASGRARERRSLASGDGYTNDGCILQGVRSAAATSTVAAVAAGDLEAANRSPTSCDKIVATTTTAATATTTTTTKQLSNLTRNGKQAKCELNNRNNHSQHHHHHHHNHHHHHHHQKQQQQQHRNTADAAGRRDQSLASQQHGSGVIPKARIKTIKMTLVIVAAYILCWSPFLIVNLCGVFGLLKNDNTNISHALMTLTQSLAHLNSAVNPIIYWIFSSKRSQTNATKRLEAKATTAAAATTANSNANTCKTATTPANNNRISYNGASIDNTRANDSNINYQDQPQQRAHNKHIKRSSNNNNNNNNNKHHQQTFSSKM